MTATTSLPGPIFSIVSAVYNVDRYLGDFLSSLERQSYGIENLEIILVDDGSTDDSLATLRAFEAKYPRSVQVLTKVNGGQASARNLGINSAHGELVTFIDPDDFVADNYFAEVAEFRSGFSGAEPPRLITGSIVSFHEARGVIKRDHPMLKRYAYGSRVVNLDIEPDQAQLHCTCAFFETQTVKDHGIQFDDKVRPTFEDVGFVAKYLLQVEKPLLGYVPSADYFYRKRADQSSAIGTSAANPERYTTVPRHGLLGILNHSLALRGDVPIWLQNLVLYDLAWAMKDDASLASSTGSLSDEVRAEFHSLAGEIMARISDEAVLSFAMTPLSDDLRFALMHGYKTESYSPGTFRRGTTDLLQGITQLRYRYAGEEPLEEIFCDGNLVSAVYSKRRAIEFHGRALGHERLVWVPIGFRIRIRLNGRNVHLAEDVPIRNHTIERHVGEGLAVRKINGRPDYIRHPHESVRSRLAKRYRSVRSSISRNELRKSVRMTALSTALHSTSARKKFLDSWAFMDRDVLAGDNAEHLYRYVRANHPEIKTWFILNRTSADWNRLKSDDFNLVPYGSLQWKLLMLSASHFASSHIDDYVIRPFGARYGAPRWKFTFLQHGVIKDDLSRRLGPKPLDLFVTASPAEYESIAGDNNRYPFSAREVKLTGLPRHDALVARRERVAAQDRDLILIMPTWRKSLAGASLTTANDRAKLDGFMDTEYARQYSELLNSERLLEFARENSLTIAFMPHPNMKAHLDDFTCPAEVEIHSYETSEVQDLLARGRVFITDYSSMAFNAAAIDLPTLYFQFDQEDFYKGDHVGRKGYFDYERDGFGPVCLTLAEVEDSIAELVTPTANGIDYSQRMYDTFKYHDKSNSQRVYEAMIALDKPVV